jgi:hypothetical protein
VHGSFYVQQHNNGTQAHRDVVEVGSDDGSAWFVHDLEWITEDGRLFFTERRSLRATLLSPSSWALAFRTEMTNRSGGDITFGSPSTKGRENAGYGGLFWRGPRSFTGGHLVGPGASGGDELRGRRLDWLAFAGKHDVIDASSLVLMVDDEANPGHPTQWFARSEQFACLNPAPFFSEELSLANGETLRLKYGVGIADAEADQAPALADAVRGALD